MKTQGRRFKDFFKKPKKSRYLKGKLLLSMPQMSDSRFHRAAILICAHDHKGAMGIRINQKMPNVDLEELCQQVGVVLDEADTHFSVYSGGPVETSRGFILHSSEYRKPETVDVNEEFAVTGTADALRAIIKGEENPEHMIFALGYTGWTKGQLDQEMVQNSWLVAKPDTELIFKTPISQIWDNAIQSMGIDLSMLSSQSGHA